MYPHIQRDVDMLEKQAEEAALLCVEKREAAEKAAAEKAAAQKALDEASEKAAMAERELEDAKADALEKIAAFQRASNILGELEETAREQDRLRENAKKYLEFIRDYNEKHRGD